MLRITICVGSSCSVHGSDELAAELEGLIAAAHAEDQIELVGAFCMEKCSPGVSIRVGTKQCSSIRPGDARSFFEDEVLPCLAPKESP